jgi:hypothetical protein
MVFVDAAIDTVRTEDARLYVIVYTLFNVRAASGINHVKALVVSVYDQLLRQLRPVSLHLAF